jgi:hypothetical protein
MGKVMKASLGQQRDGLLVNLSELSKACPFHQSNPEDCPLFPLRKMKSTKRLRWLRALSEADLSYLATYHHICLRIKLELEQAVGEPVEGALQRPACCRQT